MLNEQRGEELARIRTIVMLACPNGGSEYLRSLRHILGYGRHAQAGHLEVLNRQVADTQRAVLQRIVNATGVDAGQCRIPFHVYAGNADRIVTPASAQGAFPGASALAGTHFSILDPTAPGNRTAETVKHHILTDIRAGYTRPVHGAPAAGGDAKMAAAADPRAENGKYVVDARGAHGLQIGEGNIQNNLFRSPSPEASEEPLLQDQAGTPSTTLPRAGRPHAVPQSSARPASAWDPHRLGVHPAITAEPSGDPTADLTPYVTRGHDAELRTRLSSPTGPVMSVLVGGSSTGKTRSALEAVRACLPDWPLIRPVDAAELLDQMRSGAIGPRTILWLNEAQVYLRDRQDAASALRRLLAGEEPLAVVGTLWPEYWNELTSRPAEGDADVRHQARELLTHDAHRIYVAETFTAHDLAELHRQRAGDPRLEAAAEAARNDGKVIQVLAGGPELVRRYEHPAGAKGRYGSAVLTAAMDVRRLGYESKIAPTLLEAAAASYLAPSDRTAGHANWFEMGLTHAAEEIHGIAALTANRDQPSPGLPEGYVLHDYLDQHARITRRSKLIPAATWDA
jgi:hypothetical protein